MKRPMTALCLLLAGFAVFQSDAATYTLTVTDGIATPCCSTSGTKITGLEKGDEVEVSPNKDKIGEYGAFQRWVVTPADADLGDQFNPLEADTKLVMPAANVKLKAQIVSKVEGYLCIGYKQLGEIEDADADYWWSLDGGKTKMPFADDPYAEDAFRYFVAAGTYTVSFYCSSASVQVPAPVKIAVPKRKNAEDDLFWYSETVQFIAKDIAVKVKLDTNNGKAFYMWFADGCEYESLPFADGKNGQVFAGWWTEATGGTMVSQYGGVFDAALFAGQSVPTLYAHWLQIQKLTLKDASASAGWSLNEEDFAPELVEVIWDSLFYSNPDLMDGGSLEGKGSIEVPSGARVYVSADGSIDDKVFQKWTVTPSGIDLGARFRVTDYSAEFTMPAADVTLQATYIDESACGWLEAYASADPIFLGVDEETGDYMYIYPQLGAFEWSPDGGKTWYKATQYGEYDDYYASPAMLKQGTYKLTWRSTDPCWTPTYYSAAATVYAGEYYYPGATFVYVPEVVVDTMVCVKGECSSTCEPSSKCGTATMNPKDGLVPIGKTITLTAKAAKDYAFQGWTFGRDWKYGDAFWETQATWKLENYNVGACSDEGCLTESLLSLFIDPADKKVHVLAVFKAVADYSDDDIAFGGFITGSGGSYAATEDVVDVRAVVGCSVECLLFSAPEA